MSYNIMKKRAGFAGSTEGTIENIVDTHTDQAISGSKSFSNTVTSSADVMLSGSGKISASFFYGDGSGLSGVSSGGAAAQGPVESIQFHTGSGGLSGSANLTFLTSSNTLEVTGDISASVNISASSFYGDGSNLTDIAAANISGQLSPTQIAHSSPLTNSGGTLDVKIVSNSGIIDSSGLKLGIDSMNVAPYNDTYFVAVSDGLDNPYKIQFSTIESFINIDGNNITGSNSINNAVLPSTMSLSVISASTGISGAFFEGDGSGLTGVTASPTPAGSNTQIQFNDDGALAGDADLTFLTGSNTLATTIVSASAHVSASEFATAGGTVIDSAGNFAGSNASFNEITASSDISSSGDVYGNNFRGNGSTLDNVPLVQSNGASVVFIDNAGNQTITSNANFRYNGSDVFNDAGGFSGSADLQVGGHITGSGDLRLLNDGNIRLGGNSVISFDDGAGQFSTISQGGTNQLTIDADNRLTIKADEYVIFHDSGGNERFLIDYRTDDGTSPEMVRTDLPISTSATISASSAHLAEGMNIAGETIFNSQGNIIGTSATAVITIADNPTNGDTLSFGDSTITPVVVSTYDTRGISPNIAIGLTEAATRTNTKNRLESLHNVSVTINGNDLEITNNNLGLIGNRTISETFSTGSNSVSGFTGGYSIDIYANDITASSFSSPDGTLISTAGDFQGNNASFNEITASSVISSSAEISASSFHGDGSALTGVGGSSYMYVRHPAFNISNSNATTLIPLNLVEGRKGAAVPEIFFTAPASGSISRVSISKGLNAASGSCGIDCNAPQIGDTYVFYMYVNSIDSTTGNNATMHCTSSATNLKQVTYTYTSTSETRNKVIFDIKNSKPFASGSNSFDPGDQLVFGLYKNNGVADDRQSVVITLELDESWSL